jgi:integrase
VKKAEKLSPSSIDSLPEGKHPDPLAAGLCVIVSATGRRSWHFRRRIAKSGTIIRMKLGAFPAHSMANAREWAGKLNDAIERGVDPRIEIRAEKARTMAVEDAHDIYMAVLRRGDRKVLKPRTLADKQVIFTRDIQPRLGRTALKALTENDCWDAVYAKARASKDRANKMAGELSCFLRWCSGREGRMAGIDLPTHPAPTLNSNWFATGPKANRRFLSEDELKLLLEALAEEEDRTRRRGVLLLLLSAARRTELTGAPAKEVADGVWTLPPERSKNGQPNTIAFGPWGRELAKTNHAWLLPSGRIDGPLLHGWFKVRDRLHERMEKKAGEKIASWHFHDLRRTFRSHARSVGIDRDVAELMLNHTRKGMDRIYDANEELALRAGGFLSWERYLVDLASAASIADRLGIPPE